MSSPLACAACGAALESGARVCAHCGTMAARRRCGTCFDLNLPDDLACRRCGTRLSEAAADRAPGSAACPGCGSAMGARALSGFSFDECDACGGLWLPPAVLEQVKERASTRAQQRPVETLPPAPQAPATVDRVVYRRCPSCRALMNRSHLAPGSGFVTDLCKSHGVYFDHGELARLFTFIESGGLIKARRREEEALKAKVSAARREAFRSGPDEPIREDPPSLVSELASLLGRWIARR